MEEIRNTIAIRKDRRNIYIELQVQSSAIARFGLLILNLLVFSVLIIFMFTLGKNNDFSEETVIPFLFLLGINIWLIRNYLWNKYGKEYLIISKNTFSYYYDYGIMQTRRTSFDCKDLSIAIIKLNSAHKKGTLSFMNYNEKNNLQEEVHPTSVYISDDDIFLIISEVYNFLGIDINTEHDAGGFHYNK